MTEDTSCSSYWMEVAKTVFAMFFAKFCVFDVTILLSFNIGLLGFFNCGFTYMHSGARCVKKLNAFCTPVAFLKEVLFPSLQNICG